MYKKCERNASGFRSVNSSLHCYRDILSFLKHHAEHSANKPFVHLALPNTQGTVSFSDAWEDIYYRRAELAHAGVPRGGLVLLFLPQSWEAIAYYLATILHGCTASFMPCPSAKQDPDLYWAAHVKLMQRIAPAALITDDNYAEQIGRNGLLEGGAILYRARSRPVECKAEVAETVPVEFPWVDLDPDSTPILQHSSGTTGLKKGVMLTHHAILAQVESYTKAIQATEDDVVVSWLPLYHDMGLVACLLTPMILGQTIVLLDPFNWVSRPCTLFAAIARYRGTLCWLPNFAFDHIVRTVEPDVVGMNLATMRAFINCSETCQALTFRRFAKKFHSLNLSESALHVCYAMAETTFAATQTPVNCEPTMTEVDRTVLYEQGRASSPLTVGTKLELLSVGHPIDGTQVSIRDIEGKLVPDGIVGEICVTSSSLFCGYFNMPDETAMRLRDGTYFTRDRGFMQHGELYVLGRLDDLIIVAGRNFHATEVEDALNRVEGLKAGRNVAFGIANADRGTLDLIVVAETLANVDTNLAEPSCNEIRGAMRNVIFQTLGIYPAQIKLVRQGWLLKTTSGKIERSGNAAKYLQEAQATTKGRGGHDR
jgi:fatty-acyl-CoA synthase